MCLPAFHWWRRTCIQHSLKDVKESFGYFQNSEELKSKLVEIGVLKSFQRRAINFLHFVRWATKSWCHQKGGVQLTANTIKPLALHLNQILIWYLAHTSPDSPQDLIYLLNPRSIDYASWTHNNRQTFESPDSCFAGTHADASQRTIPFNIHKVFTSESTSSLFISIHRTSTVSIKSLAVSLS